VSAVRRPSTDDGTRPPHRQRPYRDATLPYGNAR